MSTFVDVTCAHHTTLVPLQLTHQKEPLLPTTVAVMAVHKVCTVNPNTTLVVAVLHVTFSSITSFSVESAVTSASFSVMSFR